jgi:ABC-type branched-subunit amino acid transport system ATPase component
MVTLLLDEPAGGVKLTMLAHLRERLRAYHAEHHATFVVIEHQMEFVMALCTRVLVLAEGRIIAEGAPQDIRRNPADSLGDDGQGRVLQGTGRACGVADRVGHPT